MIPQSQYSNSAKRLSISIDDQTFEVTSIDVQYSLNVGIGHATILIGIDINSNPSYYQYFIKKYEASKKFDLYHRKFIALGSFIKSMDISFDDTMNISIICDVIEASNIQYIRDEIIEDILNSKTLPNNNDIT